MREESLACPVCGRLPTVVYDKDTGHITFSTCGQQAIIERKQ